VGEALLGGRERLTPALLGPQMLRRLIATISTEETVLSPVGLLSLVQDVGDELLIGAVCAA
jgi:hypothetical protein